MSRGGYRAGAGRPKGAKDKKPRKLSKKSKAGRKTVSSKEKASIKKLLSLSLSAKAKMYQGFLLKINSGQPLTKKEKDMMDSIGAELADTVEDGGVKRTSKDKDIDPLTYMLKVMNDDTADPERRDRMAGMAAPYVHAKVDKNTSKKQEQAARAKKAGSGRFSAADPPKLKAVK